MTKQCCNCEGSGLLFGETEDDDELCPICEGNGLLDVGEEDYEDSCD